jgi:hypothetical protein
MPQLDTYSLMPIGVGLLLLLLGRKVFWLFTGAVVFVLGMNLLGRFLPLSTTHVFYISVGLGVLAALATVFLQKVFLRIAGFLAGGYILMVLAERFPVPEGLPWWLPFVLGGLLGAVLLSFLFEWALIVLSSLTGAFLIVQHLSLEQTTSTIVLAVLALVGIVVQARGKRGKKKAE